MSALNRRHVVQRAVRSNRVASNLQLVELTKAERWDGVLPTTMLPNNTIPFLDAKK